MSNSDLVETPRTFFVSSFTPEEVVGCLTVETKLWASARKPLDVSHEEDARTFVFDLFRQLLDKDRSLPAYNRGYAIAEPSVEIIKDESPGEALILMYFDYAPVESAILLHSTRMIICPLDVLLATDD